MSLALVSPAPSVAALAYRAMATTFMSFGFVTGLWGGAIPVVVLHAGLSARSLGIALTLYMMAYLVSSTLTGFVAARLSARRSFLLLLPAMAGALAFVLLAPNASIFFLAFSAYGAIAGMLDISVNTEGTSIEADFGRPILASLHGCASIGQATGAIVGSFVAVSLGLSATAMIGVLAMLTAMGAVSAATPERGIVRANAAAPAGGMGGRGLLVLMGVLAGISMAAEMSSATWSAPLLTLQSPEFGAYAGFGAALFGLSQAVLRFQADRLRRRFGDLKLLAGSLAVACFGTLIVATSPSFAVSALGFGLIGLGTACIVPCSFAYAVLRSPLAPAVSLSVVAFATAFARLPAPYLVGEIATRLSIAASFALFAALFAVAIGIATLLLHRSRPLRLA